MNGRIVVLVTLATEGNNVSICRFHFDVNFPLCLNFTTKCEIYNGDEKSILSYNSVYIWCKKVVLCQKVSHDVLFAENRFTWIIHRCLVSPK